MIMPNVHEYFEVAKIAMVRVIDSIENERLSICNSIGP
jgi:hypothetical protein